MLQRTLSAKGPDYLPVAPPTPRWVGEAAGRSSRVRRVAELLRRRETRAARSVHYTGGDETLQYIDGVQPRYKVH